MIIQLNNEFIVRINYIYKINCVYNIYHQKYKLLKKVLINLNIFIIITMK